MSKVSECQNVSEGVVRMAYLRPEGSAEGKYVPFWKSRLYTEKAFVAFLRSF